MNEWIVWVVVRAICLLVLFAILRQYCSCHISPVLQSNVKNNIWDIQSGPKSDIILVLPYCVSWTVIKPGVNWFPTLNDVTRFGVISWSVPEMFAIESEVVRNRAEFCTLQHEQITTSSFTEEPRPSLPPPHKLSTDFARTWFIMLLGGSVVRALDSGPRGREFDSRRLRFRVTRSTQPSIPPW